MAKELDKELSIILAWYRFALAMNKKQEKQIEKETINLIKKLLDKNE